LASVLSLVVGIMAVAGEYRYRTITDTYLATPSRTTVVAAKVVVYSAFGALIGIVSTATALATAAVWLNAKDSVLSPGMDGAWKTIAGCIVWNTCFGALGVGIGALVRNVVGAVSGALVWIAVVEGLVAQLIGDNGKWLAFRSGVALEGVSSPGLALLPQWGGGLMLVAYAGAMVTVALATSMRRDVT
jgi:ABC-2 type transport system permease protein